MGLILLVRHGQASFGAADYDQLSAVGESQAHQLGQHLGLLFPQATVITGSMQRQLATGAIAAAAAGWRPPTTVDERWNEYDHVRLLDSLAVGPQGGDLSNFQHALEEELRRWANGGRAELGETFGEFQERTREAMSSAARSTTSAPTVVVTSNGVIGSLAAGLLGGGLEQFILLHRVCVNTGITRVVTGRRGASLVSFNDYGHLAADAATYR